MNIYDKNPEYSYIGESFNKEYYKETQKLSERLGIDRNIDLSDSIFVSGLGTVKMKDSKGNTSEIPFDEFIRNIDANIKRGTNLVKYDKESNRFYLIEMKRDPNSSYTYNYEAHKLNVDDKSMVDYGLGNYDRTTLMLHNLCLKSGDKQELISSDENKERFKNEVILKAESSHEQLSPLEAKVYLDYLKDLDKQHAKTAAKEAGKVTAVTGPPVIGGVAMSASMIAKVIGGAAAVGFAPGIGISVFAGLLTAGAVVLGEELASLFVAMVKDDYEPYKLFSNCREALEVIKEKIEDIKVNRAKEKYLRQTTDVDKVVLADSVTVEEQPAKPLELEDNIMSEINALVDKTAFINPEDREKMLTQAKELLNTYMVRSKNIINQDKSIMDPEADNMVNLRIDVCKQLAKMEMQLSAIREKDKKHDALNSEGKLLNDKIAEVSNLNSSQPNESKKEAEVAEMLSDNTDDYEVLDADYNVVKLA